MTALAYIEPIVYRLTCSECGATRDIDVSGAPSRWQQIVARDALRHLWHVHECLLGGGVPTSSDERFVLCPECHRRKSPGFVALLERSA